MRYWDADTVIYRMLQAIFTPLVLVLYYLLIVIYGIGLGFKSLWPFRRHYLAILAEDWCDWLGTATAVWRTLKEDGPEF